MGFIFELFFPGYLGQISTPEVLPLSPVKEIEELVKTAPIEAVENGDTCKSSSACLHGSICGKYGTCEPYIDKSGERCSNSFQELTCGRRRDGVDITILNKCWVDKMEVTVLYEGACE